MSKLGLRHLLALAVVVVTFGWSSQAFAESDVQGVAELRLGGYYPGQIDSDVSGGDPFQNTFGGSSERLTELEVDAYLYDGIGKFGLGVSWGYVTFSGNASSGEGGDNSGGGGGSSAGNTSDGGSNNSTGSGSNGQSGTNGDSTAGAGSGSSKPTGANAISVSETTNFEVYPVRLSALYFFDYPATEWSIPLVPAFRGGLTYKFWQVKDGGDNTATYPTENGGTVEGSGGKAGWHVGAGMYFLLDVVDQSSASSFDMTWGVNNSYLFAEYLKSRVDGFGAKGLDLSDEQWMFGIATEF